MSETQQSLLGLVPLVLMTIPFIFVCYRLSKEKGKSVLLYTIMSIVPLFNVFAVFYLVGTTNKNLDAKLDELIELVRRKEQRVPGQ